MKYIIHEQQMKSILKKNFGLDLTDKIIMVTNKWELPFEFDKWMNERLLNKYLNRYGPMFVIEIGKLKYIGINLGKEDGGWNFFDQSDRPVSEFELMKLLGIESLGLSFDDLLNQYFKEEPINEQVIDEPEDNMTKVIQAYLDMNLPNYYGIKRFWVDYNEQFDVYDINIFFDRQISIDMGGGINMLLRNAINSIGSELYSMFSGVEFKFYQHFED